MRDHAELFCPYCKSITPHILVADANGLLAWCQCCFRVQKPKPSDPPERDAANMPP